MHNARKRTAVHLNGSFVTGIILAIRGDSQMLDTVKDWLEDLAIVANHKKRAGKNKRRGIYLV